MNVTNVSQATTPVIGAPNRNVNALSSLDFMNLLVVELQNQNPLEPMNTTDMASQLSQMTMAQQLTEISASMDANVLMSQSINNTAMLALVGRQVTVAGNQVEVTDGVPTGSKLNSAAPGSATVRVRDADGVEIASYTQTVSAGLNDLRWDGLLPDGSTAPDGAYTIDVSVSDVDGNSVNNTVLMTGSVSGLRYDQGLAIISVFGQEFYVSDIYQVS